MSKLATVNLCGTCGRRPAVTHYWDKCGKQVHRALPDHEECRQCHKSRTDQERQPRAEQPRNLHLSEVCR